MDELNNLTDSWWPYIITLIITIISAIRIFMGGPRCPTSSRIDGKVVLITGASGGLGLETAKELAKRGANIILTCRNVMKGAKAVEAVKAVVPCAYVQMKILDVSLLSDIKNFARELSLEYDHIDVLINNAGIIFHPMEKTLEGNELTMATNYFGPFTLTHLLLPLLNKSDNGRVINITALAHFAGKVNLNDLNGFQNFQVRDAYAQSKLCLVLFTKQMASLYKKTNITFNSVNPGLVRNTDHLRRSSLQTSIYTKISVWPWMWLFMKTPNQGCQSIVYAAVEPALHNVSGAYISDCEQKESAKAAFDCKLAEELYKKTCKICDIDADKISQSITSDEIAAEFIHVQ